MVKVLSRDKFQRMVGGRSSGGSSSSGGGTSMAGYATQSWVNENYLSIEFFGRLFTVHGENDAVVTPNDMDATITSLESMFGFWTDLYISAMGNGDSGSGAALYLSQLGDVSVSGVTNGQVLTYDNSSGKWIPANVSRLDMAAVWTALAASTNEQINASHLSTAFSTASVNYATSAGSADTANTATSAGYATIAGRAGTADALTNTRTIWGQNFNGTANITGPATSMTSIDATMYFDTTNKRVGINVAAPVCDLHANGGIKTNSYIQIGDVKLVYDSTNDAIQVIKSDGNAGNFYATGYVSALGSGGSGGGGGSVTLNEPLQSINNASLGAPSASNLILAYNGSAWVYRSTSNLSVNYATSAGTAATATTATSANYASSAGAVAWDNVSSKPSAVGGSTQPVYWNGSTFVACTSYANASVNYATSAGTASSAAYATNAGSADSASYASSAGAVAWGNVTSKPSAVGGSTQPVYWTGSGFTACTSYANASVNYATSSGTSAACTGNSATATALQTARTIWGQSFNGTANITGTAHMSNGAKFTNICIECNNNLSTTGRTSEINNYTSQLFLQYNTSNDVTLCYGGGNVMVGTGTASYKLHVDGVIYSSTGVYSAGYVTALSDIRYKNVEERFTLAVDDIAKMSAIKFRWKYGCDKELQAGAIAQEWQKLLPEVVRKGVNGQLSIDYSVASLVSVISVAKTVSRHEKEIENLKAEIKELKRLIH